MIDRQTDRQIYIYEYTYTFNIRRDAPTTAALSLSLSLSMSASLSVHQKYWKARKRTSDDTYTHSAQVPDRTSQMSGVYIAYMLCKTTTDF